MAIVYTHPFPPAPTENINKCEKARIEDKNKIIYMIIMEKDLKNYIKRK